VFIGFVLFWLKHHLKNTPKCQVFFTSKSTSKKLGNLKINQLQKKQKIILDKFSVTYIFATESEKHGHVLFFLSICEHMLSIACNALAYRLKASTE
jgi:competence transcription factor ComK